MQVNIIAIGKNNSNSLKELYEQYQKRLVLLKVTIHEVDDRKASQKIIDQKLYNLINYKFYTIALSEFGKNMSSIDFSKLIFSYDINIYGGINFIIGGSSGLMKESLDKANLILSLGILTFPHLIARLLLLEQIYRAETIKNNHPYHRS